MELTNEQINDSINLMRYLIRNKKMREYNKMRRKNETVQMNDNESSKRYYHKHKNDADFMQRKRTNALAYYHRMKNDVEFMRKRKEYQRNYVKNS